MLVLLIVGASSLVVLACGSTSKGAGSASQAASKAVTSSGASTASSSSGAAEHYLNDGDNDPSTDDDADSASNDNDNDLSEENLDPENGSYHDKDDGSILAFGHGASPSEKRAITAVVKHYYAVASAADGAKACSMLAPSLAGAVAEDYGRGSGGPPYLAKGTSCPAVMTMLFKHIHGQLPTDLEVTEVRVSGGEAHALLGSRTMPASEMSVGRDHGSWKLAMLIASPLS